MLPGSFIAGAFARRPGRGHIAQDRDEHRDRGRVLNPLRESVLDSGAPRVVRADLTDGFPLLVAHGGLLCRTAREGRDATIGGTITHEVLPRRVANQGIR
jgi:hypothetical protein